MKKSKVLFFSLLLLSFTPYKAAEPTDIPEIQELIFKPRRETCFFSASQQTRPCTKEDFLEIDNTEGESAESEWTTLEMLINNDMRRLKKEDQTPIKEIFEGVFDIDAIYVAVENVCFLNIRYFLEKNKFLEPSVLQELIERANKKKEEYKQWLKELLQKRDRFREIPAHDSLVESFSEDVIHVMRTLSIAQYKYEQSEKIVDFLKPKCGIL